MLPADCTLALDPGLGLSAAAFAAAWNGDAECRALATARPAAGAPAGYDAGLADAGVAVALSLAAGVAANAVWERLKQIGAEWTRTPTRTRRRVDIMEIQLPDGTRLFVLKSEEG